MRLIRAKRGHNGSRKTRVARRLGNGEQGSALVEMALVFPVLLITLTGIFTMGVAINQDLQLTDAVSVGGQVLAVDRANTLDPCADVYTAVTNAAPYLDSTKMVFSFTLNGTSYGPYTGSATTCSSTSNSTGAPADLVQGDPVTITVTYPCSLSLYGNTNLIPGCKLPAQITELVQ